jgi:hypothetical protein
LIVVGAVMALAQPAAASARDVDPDSLWSTLERLLRGPAARKQR